MIRFKCILLCDIVAFCLYRDTTKHVAKGIRHNFNIIAFRLEWSSRGLRGLTALNIWYQHSNITHNQFYILYYLHVNVSRPIYNEQLSLLKNNIGN